MTVSFMVDDLIYPIGSGDFLHSFFSTICYHLENDQWGSRYPYLMNDLYQHSLTWRDVPFARRELQDVQKKLRRLPPASVVWDRDDLSQSPPWGNAINASITDLAHYFVTNDGRELIDVLFLALDDAWSLQQSLTIVSL